MTDAIPQKNWAPITINSTKIAQLSPSDCWKIDTGAARLAVIGYWNPRAVRYPPSGGTAAERGHGVTSGLASTLLMPRA